MTAIISAGGVTTAFNYFQNRRKSGAEANKIEQEAQDLIVSRYERLTKRLEERIDELEKENRQLMLVSLRMERKLSKISSLLASVLSENDRQREPFRSIIEELKDEQHP